MIAQEMNPPMPQEQAMAPDQMPGQMPDQGGEDPRALTQASKEGVVAKTPGKLKSPMDRFVTAGMRMMFDPETHEKMMGQFQQLPGKPAQKLAMGVASLMAILVEKAKGPFPPEALIPASVVLLMEAIDFLGEAGQIEVTSDLVAESTHKLMQLMMTKLGLGPNQGQDQEAPPAEGEIPGGVSPSTRQTDPQPAPGAAPGLIQGAQ